MGISLFSGWKSDVSSEKLFIGDLLTNNCDNNRFDSEGMVSSSIPKGQTRNTIISQ